MTTIRLVFGAGCSTDRVRGVLSDVALLVSYFYRRDFERNRPANFRDYVLDSGAFSARSSGIEIDLAEFADYCLALRANDPKLVEVFSLDVIGDWRASAKNLLEMHARGVTGAIPTLHYGSPWGALDDMPPGKIALGGMVGRPTPMLVRWLDQAFARVWPRQIHGFGVTSEKLLMKFPFHSVDSSSWELGPAFGAWRAYGKLPKRPDARPSSVGAEVEYFLRLERKLQSRWAKMMEEIA